MASARIEHRRSTQVGPIEDVDERRSSAEPFSQHNDGDLRMAAVDRPHRRHALPRKRLHHMIGKLPPGSYRVLKGEPKSREVGARLS
jgi:hypothetical protein